MCNVLVILFVICMPIIAHLNPYLLLMTLFVYNYTHYQAIFVTVFCRRQFYETLLKLSGALLYMLIQKLTMINIIKI